MKAYPLPIERIHAGQPIVAPTTNLWESGGTINAAAVYLERSPENDGILRGLLGQDDLNAVPQGVVAVLYRAFPRSDAGVLIPVSTTGLAVFTPELEPLKRFSEPVLLPNPGKDSFDYFGIEDPRVTRIGDTFYLLYCGAALDPVKPYRTRLCMATSKDLLHWEKHGPIPGGPDRWDNKDGILFPEPIHGQYFLLHRPWGEGFAVPDYSIWMAGSSSPFGPWQEYGQIVHSYEIPGCRQSWLGGGSVPIPLGDSRYLEVYHTGNYLTGNDREYDMGAVLLDFSRFTPENPSAVVTHRLEPMMAPAGEYECLLMPDGSHMDVVFPCGTYRFHEDLYLIYGAGDLYTCAARVNFNQLLNAVQQHGLENPYTQ